MHKRSIFTTVILGMLITIQIVNSANISDALHIGVKSGDFAIYEYHNSLSDLTNLPTDLPLHHIQISGDALYKIKVISNKDNVITFETQTQRNMTYAQIGANWASIGTVSADPTVENVNPPESSVHAFFFPSNLGVGAPFPTFIKGWRIWVNETIPWRLGEVERTVNHATVHRILNETRAEGLQRTFITEDFFFDKLTGLMVRWSYGYTIINYELDNTLHSATVLTQSYELKETNIWSEPIWLNRYFLITSLIVTISAIILIFLYFHKKLRGLDDSLKLHG